ncbi:MULTISPECIES: amidohydrolase family protein [unclassified Caballeronia]|jgi:predicted TIM-barrel fold metal-dependent hydrolase|uniref:amidohydrolase family protein n=1 Tax=unclassified Caballeronia TaxID=2646786 RepID=UPI001FD5F90F|nr:MULTISPECIES: amidohydrolase family protein [unclassified Caballeronia]MDR5800358.1 amidohydrolase family protein [Caballeronia sp. LZ001]
MTTNTLGFDLPILDAHHHFWDLSDGDFPWLTNEYDDAFFLGDYRRMCQDFLPPQYRQATAGFNVIGTVHVEAERSRKQQVRETDWLTALNAKTGLPSAIVGHVFFVQPDCDAILAGHANSPLARGVRSKPEISSGPHESVAGQPGTMQDEAWLAGLALLDKYGFSWDLRVPYWHLEEAAEVARAFPKTPIVTNHLGLPLDRSDEGVAIWRRGMEKLAACPNVYLKVSELGLPNGTWDSASNRRVIREAVDLFGYERSMFASNLPVGNLSASFTEIVADVLGALPQATETDLRALFEGTARRFYRVE